MKHTPFDNYEAKNGWKLGVEKLKYSQPFGKELMQRVGQVWASPFVQRASEIFVYSRPARIGENFREIGDGGTVKV